MRGYFFFCKLIHFFYLPFCCWALGGPNQMILYKFLVICFSNPVHVLRWWLCFWGNDWRGWLDPRLACIAVTLDSTVLHKTGRVNKNMFHRCPIKGPDKWKKKLKYFSKVPKLRKMRKKNYFRQKCSDTQFHVWKKFKVMPGLHWISPLGPFSR